MAIYDGFSSPRKILRPFPSHGNGRGGTRVGRSDARMTARIFIHTAVHKYPSCESRFAENDSHREIPSRCAICAQHSNIFIIDGYLGIVLHMEDDR